MIAQAFDAASLAHVAHRRRAGEAAERVLTRRDFAEAVAEIAAWPGYAPTPLHRLDAWAAGLGLDSVLYKDEGPRFGLGSFKALGGAYAAQRLLAREASRRRGAAVALAEVRDGRARPETGGITLVSATDGNHGRSLAWGCRRFGAPCRIYIHAGVSEGRARAMHDLGAEVVRVAGDYDASVARAREEAEANGWFVVSDTSWEGYTQPPKDVMAGYGAMSAEIVTALEEPPSHVVLQGGVGGLAASVAAYFRQAWKERRPRVVVAEPERAACLFASAQAGRMTPVRIEEETVMAGLSCGEPSPLAWAILAEEASDFVTVPDAVVGPTLRRLARPVGDDPVIQAGESAVAGLAALVLACRSGEARAALGLDAKARVLVIGSEGITDPEIYARMMREDGDG